MKREDREDGRIKGNMEEVLVAVLALVQYEQFHASFAHS